jgi:hypothetical protein
MAFPIRIGAIDLPSGQPSQTGSRQQIALPGNNLTTKNAPMGAFFVVFK